MGGNGRGVRVGELNIYASGFESSDVSKEAKCFKGEFLWDRFEKSRRNVIPVDLFLFLDMTCGLLIGGCLVTFHGLYTRTTHWMTVPRSITLQP